MSNKNNALNYNYLCEIEEYIIELLSRPLNNIRYDIDIMKVYVNRINKIKSTTLEIQNKKIDMTDQLNGIIRTYELVYLNQENDSDTDYSDDDIIIT